jgi:hypothetical protein
MIPGIDPPAMENCTGAPHAPSCRQQRSVTELNKRKQYRRIRFNLLNNSPPSGYN